MCLVDIYVNMFYTLFFVHVSLLSGGQGHVTNATRTYNELEKSSTELNIFTLYKLAMLINMIKGILHVNNRLGSVIV